MERRFWQFMAREFDDDHNVEAKQEDPVKADSVDGKLSMNSEPLSPLVFGDEPDDHDHNFDDKDRQDGFAPTIQSQRTLDALLMHQPPAPFVSQSPRLRSSSLPLCLRLVGTDVGMVQPDRDFRQGVDVKYLGSSVAFGLFPCPLSVDLAPDPGGLTARSVFDGFQGGFLPGTSEIAFWRPLDPSVVGSKWRPDPMCLDFRQCPAKLMLWILNKLAYAWDRRIHF